MEEMIFKVDDKVYYLCKVYDRFVIRHGTIQTIKTYQDSSRSTRIYGVSGAVYADTPYVYNNIKELIKDLEIEFEKYWNPLAK